MGLKGKLVSQIDIKSDGNLFYQIFRERPYDTSVTSPGMIHRVDLHCGEWGTVGSVTLWKFILDGNERVSKEMIEAIDDERKTVTYKVIEGDLAELYKTFKYIIIVDSNGDRSLITWTLEYEKKNENVPDPNTMMALCLALTKDIETHNLAQLN
ncbi:kirola-like [Olea europaea var. sylvestris]|uniref:kirola-like n=1 Tax=Olea europaea var. sylvestris TaxID=158386 RepID=UPI000C1CDF1A|nr:kirola-like [Olea europaea var. sylvestris]